MNTTFFKQMRRTMLVGAGAVVMLTACNPEPDESDLYTFTGETIESYIAKDSSLTAFNYILSRVGYDKMMASYGSYTCFAPINEGVYAYCDSLFNDPKATIPNNGMTENSLEGLSDSLCLNIVRYHLSNTYRNIVSMTGDVEVSTMLGYDFSCHTEKNDSLQTTYVVLNNKAIILESDAEVTNGLVHKIDNVIPRPAEFIGDLLSRHGDYKIFSKALEMTGWDKKLLDIMKEGTYEFRQLPRQSYSSTLSYDTQCKMGYTVFAENDDVMSRNGINNIDELIAYANKMYGNALKWYNYMEENGLTVSTGDDYENEFNALNMFVAYHIIGVPMSANQMVYEKTGKYWHFAPTSDLYDYYETKLPHTILKVWEPDIEKGDNSLYVNRYRTNNTLTNEVGTRGTNHDENVNWVLEHVDGNPTKLMTGCKINRTSSIRATNGYVHSIGNMLVYDETVPKMVLNERMRFNCTSLFPELIANGYRSWEQDDGNIPSTYDTSRRGIPLRMIDNIMPYTDDICFAYDIHGWWRSWEADQLQFWGNFDFAFKLPPVPTGLYELRIIYPPLSYGGFMQYYIGKSSDIQTMEALGIPYDMQILGTDPRIGWTAPHTEEDFGIETDQAMRNRGYMRAPYSFYGGTGVTSWTKGEVGGNAGNNSREEGSLIRAILGTIRLEQGTDNWMRIKSLKEDPQLIANLDFIEIVPVSVVNSQEYFEDWY